MPATHSSFLNKMSTPWSDGFYYSTESPFINEVKGNTVYLRNLVELEYPDIGVDSSMKGSWTFGKFHETSKEIHDKTGAKHYDVEIIGKLWILFTVATMKLRLAMKRFM